MSLLHLLTDMVDDDGVRRRFLTDRSQLLKDYGIDDDDDIAALDSESGWELLMALAKHAPKKLRSGDKRVAVTFCGVMKGVGGGGGGGYPDINAAKTLSKKPNLRQKTIKKQRKKK